MKKAVLVITGLLFLLSIGYCKEQPLQLTIASDKQTYEVGQEIWIAVNIINNSEINLLLKSPGFEVSSDNLEVPIYSPIRFSDNMFDDTPGTDKETISLELKNNLTLKYNLYDLKWNHILSSKWADTDFNKFIQPGKYQILLKLTESPVMYGPKYIEYTSNAITIEVVEKVQDRIGTATYFY